MACNPHSDCTDKIISAGFVDTHHHTWQSLLKGRHANQTLMQYMPEGNFTSSMHSPEDTFWGQLAGCMEMIDCGTTSVVDFSHINYSAEHSKSLPILTRSGIITEATNRRSSPCSYPVIWHSFGFLLLSNPEVDILDTFHHKSQCPG
jgi:hypothetical protein